MPQVPGSPGHKATLALSGLGPKGTASTNFRSRKEGGVEGGVLVSQQRHTWCKAPRGPSLGTSQGGGDLWLAAEVMTSFVTLLQLVVETGKAYREFVAPAIAGKSP